MLRRKKNPPMSDRINAPVRSAESEGASGVGSRALTVTGIILCVVLVPILIINCTLIINGILFPDKVPSIGGYIPLIVKSPSMQDVIPAGSLIICQEADPQDIEVGNIISFFDPEVRKPSVVTHQVVRLERDIDPVTGEAYTVSWRTKGTTNDTEDRLSAPTENLVGIYTGICFAGVGSVLLFMQSTTGLLLCLFIPIAAIIAYEVLRRRRKDRAKQDDIDALRAELAALKAEKQPPAPATEEVAASPATEADTPPPAPAAEDGA